MAAYEKLIAIEVEDEDGNVGLLNVRRIVTRDPDNPPGLGEFSNELIFRPGGGAIAKRLDTRTVTTADDAIADAHRRQEREVAALRERGMFQARTGGNGATPEGLQAGGDREPAPAPAGGGDGDGDGGGDGDPDRSSAPAHRPRRQRRTAKPG